MDEKVLIGVRIVGLMNGLEIIGKVYETDSYYYIKNGGILIPTAQNQLGLAKWLPYAKTEKGVPLNRDNVMYIVEATDEVANEYNTAFGSGIVVPTPLTSGVIGNTDGPPLKFTTD